MMRATATLARRVNSHAAISGARAYGGQALEVDEVLAGKTLHELNAELSAVQVRSRQLQNAIKFYKDDKRKRVLLVGAGKSSGWAIRYLLKHAEKENWYVKVGDFNEDMAQLRVREAAEAEKSAAGVGFKFDVNNANQRRAEIAEADVVLSLLPATMHDSLAEECVAMKKDFLTASYTSEKQKALDAKAKENGVLIITECGLDPGIDHMACMKSVHQIEAEGGEISSVESNTGGLIAPESDCNPWHYKFTWAPRNVVLAGQGGCRFIDHGEYKWIPYHKLFQRAETIDVAGVGPLEAYPNRDSLKYREKYHLEHVPTFFRGTFRYPGYCSAWNILVQLGMTSADESNRIANSEFMTYRQFTNSFMRYRRGDSVELKLAYYMGISIDSPEMQKLKWLGLFEHKQIGLANALPCDILLNLLERKWRMMPDDKDMIVMWNRFLYDDARGQPMELITSMVHKGINKEDTSMAKTVGLPLAMAARQVVAGSLNQITGLHMPAEKIIYEPLLSELEQYNIKFEEFRRPLPVYDEY